MIELDKMTFVGASLVRPECVLAHRSGSLFAADWSGAGGVSVVVPGLEAPMRIQSKASGFELRPNGIALEQDGSFLVTHLGETDGGVFRLHVDGALEPILTEVEGVPLPPTNYVHLDAFGRLWITVSTRRSPRAEAYRRDVADGFVVVADADGRNARIAADRLGYTNECVLHPDGKRLFVNETFARRLSCFDVSSAGVLSRPRTICEFGAGTFPDGLTFDTDGGIWITSIVSNRVIRVTEDGHQQLMLEDSNAEYLRQVEQAFQSASMGRPHLDNIRSQRLGHVSSLAFGGPDRRTAYLGCLLGHRIATFRSAYEGVAPVHWQAPLGKLLPRLADFQSRLSQ